MHVHMVVDRRKLQRSGWGSWGPHGDLKDVDRGVQPGRGYIELAQQREGKDRGRASGSRVTMRDYM